MNRKSWICVSFASNVILFLVLLSMGGYLVYNRVRVQVYYDQLAHFYFIYAFFFLFTMSVIISMIFLFNRQVKTPAECFAKLLERYFTGYYTVNILNQVQDTFTKKLFLIAFCVIMILDNRGLSYNDKSSYRFVSAYFTACYFFYLFSSDLFSRKLAINSQPNFTIQNRLRFAYQVYFYLVSFLIFFSYYFSISILTIPTFLVPLAILLISNTGLAVTSITKIAFLVNLFLLFSFIKIFAESIRIILDFEQSSNSLTYYVINIFVATNSSLNVLRIVYKLFKGCRNISNQYNSNSASDNQNPNQSVDYLAALNDNPRRQINMAQSVPIHRNYLLDQEIERLEIVTLMMVAGNEQQSNKYIVVPTTKQQFQNNHTEPIFQIIQDRNDVVDEEFPDQRDAPNNRIIDKSRGSIYQLCRPRPSVQFEPLALKIKSGAKEFTCSICEIDMICQERVISLRCKHLYHITCITKWLKLKNSCPMCRSWAIDLNEAQ